MSVPVTDTPPTAPPLPPDSTPKQHLPVNKRAVRILLEYLFAIYFLKKNPVKIKFDPVGLQFMSKSAYCDNGFGGEQGTRPLL